MKVAAFFLWMLAFILMSPDNELVFRSLGLMTLVSTTAYLLSSNREELSTQRFSSVSH